MHVDDVFFGPHDSGERILCHSPDETILAYVGAHPKHQDDEDTVLCAMTGNSGSNEVRSCAIPQLAGRRLLSVATCWMLVGRNW